MKRRSETTAKDDEKATETDAPSSDAAVAEPSIETPVAESEAAESNVVHINTCTVDAFVRSLPQAERESIGAGFIHEEKLRKSRRLPIDEWKNEFAKFKRAPRV